MGKRVTAAVLAALRGRTPGVLLDVPAGVSPLRAGAERLGWRVVGLDLFPRPGFAGVRGDACAPFPFRDGAFDALVSLEGIEHFENQAAFVRECARVLKPGGLMVVTTPNVLHLSARMNTFLTGQRHAHRGFVNEDQTLRGRDGDRLYHGHAFLIDVFRLRYLLSIAGLHTGGLRMGPLSHGSLALAVLAPLVWIASRVIIARGRRARARAGLRIARPEVERDILRLADSPRLLFSRKLILTASREP